ncbi:MAG: aminotransferase class IV [Rhodospirillales bacterium]|nr:aminotransferase class IV [Rhodospirillales bacterium]
MSEHTGIAFREGAYLPVEDLSISVLDPAFSCSDVVFDAVSVTDGAFFRLDDHMARFRASCDHVYMTSPYSDAEMMHIMAQCVDRAGLSDALVLALCTRGRFSDGGVKGDPRRCENEFIAYAVPYYTTVPESCAQNGVHLWVADTRRAPNAAIDQRAKNFNRMDLTRAQFEALNAGADAPLLCSTEGYIAEGPGFNLWLLRGREALTPRDNLLEGITRKTVFELCTEAGLEAKATDLTPGGAPGGANYLTQGRFPSCMELQTGGIVNRSFPGCNRNRENGNDQTHPHRRANRGAHAAQSLLRHP